MLWGLRESCVGPLGKGMPYRLPSDISAFRGQELRVGLSKLVGHSNGNDVKEVYQEVTAFVEFYSVADHGNGLNPASLSDNWNRSGTINLFNITGRNSQPIR